MRRITAALLAPMLIAAASQDLPTDQLQQHADTVRQRVLIDRTVNRARPATRRPAPSARARATCANRGRAAALHGRDHPQVRRLYALCAQAGFR